MKKYWIKNVTILGLVFTLTSIGFTPLMAIPSEVKNIMEKLAKAKFEAYVVGGCVRDLLRKVKPLDWDITTNAKPEEIKKLLVRLEIGEVKIIQAQG